jgi:hypothetical protein
MKKIFLALVMVALITTGAFAQLVIGVTGVQYYEEDVNGDLPSLSDSWEDFKDGEGVYWGGYVELILSKLGLGISFNQQTYEDPFGDSTFDMWNYDVNFFLAYHLFGGRAFIDPFLQAGVGLMAYDYKNKDDLRDYYAIADPSVVISDDPMFGSMYYDFGLGLGVNLGSVGIFAKAMWNIQSDEPLYNEDYGYEIFEWPVMPFKWTFGAKLIL